MFPACIYINLTQFTQYREEIISMALKRAISRMMEDYFNLSKYSNEMKMKQRHGGLFILYLVL